MSVVRSITSHNIKVCTNSSKLRIRINKDMSWATRDLFSYSYVKFQILYIKFKYQFLFKENKYFPVKLIHRRT